MTPLTAEQAFAAYEAVRHRLPAAAARQPAPRAAASLAGIADHFDAFLLDAFGVLNIGETAIPGAAARVAALQAAGKRVLVVSNAASLPPEALLAKYRRLGYALAPEDIVTSRTTLTAAMAGHRETLWGTMCAPGAALADFGPIATLPLDDDAAVYDRAGGFLLIGSAGWTDARQALLETALRARPRPVLVANPDIVAPREDGFSREPGHFAHLLADRAGVEPEFFGKPFPEIFAQAIARLDGIEKSRIVMVGDSLHTDILGAQAAGVASALITGYGFCAALDVPGAMARADIYPDFLVERP